MAKFYGQIGYAITDETFPGSGIWKEIVSERNYRGDILQNVNRWQPGEHLNSDVQIDNKISIVSDNFAYENLSRIRYIKWLGAKWLITKIEILRPRMILTIGGVYNGKAP